MPPWAAWKRPTRVATAPVKAPLHVAEQLGLEEGLGDGAAVDRDERALRARRAAVDLPRDDLLAGAGLAGDEHRDVGRRDLLDPPVDLAHRRARADELAVLLRLDRLLQRDVLAPQRVEQHRVLHEQRGLRGEDGERLERAVVEERDHVVVAEVDDAEDVALLHERRAHHRAELQVHDRRRARPLGVVEGVGDDDRAAGLDHPLDDRVGDPRDRVLDGLARDVARRPHRHLAVLEQDEEALVGVGHLEERVDQLVEEPREVGRAEEPLGEADERVEREEPLAGRGSRPATARGARSKKSSVAPTRIRSPGPSRQVARRFPFTVMSAPSWAAAL